MRSRTSGIVCRTAAGAGAFALALGAVACTGDDDEQSEAPESAPAATDSPPEETTPPSSDGGGGSPFGEDDLDAASARFLALLQVLDDRDWEAACVMVLDPTTGTAPEGERLEECVDDVEPTLGEHVQMFEPGVFDGLDVSMIEAVDNGNGTVSLSVLNEKLDVPLAPGEDGRWYLAVPF